MKTIINTAILVSILLTLLFIMRRETEALNGKIMKLHGKEKNAIEVVNPDASSAHPLTQ